MTDTLTRDTDTEAAWHEWRRAGITATDVAKAATGKYGGLWSVLAEKRGEPVDEPDDDARDRMQRGKDLEVSVAAMVEICTGHYIAGDETWCEHADRPEHRATVDRFAFEHEDDDLADALCPVEIKTHDIEARPSWDYYLDQVEWQLWVTGFPWALLAVSAYDPALDLIHGPRLEIVNPDVFRRARLLEAAEAIARHMHDDTWPDPDGSDAAGVIIDRQSDPNPDAEPVDLTDVRLALAEYATIAALTAKGGPKAVLSQRIKAALGDATRGIADGYEVTWSTPANELDADALLAAHPEFAKSVVDLGAATKALGRKGLDEFRRPTGSRRLTVHRIETESE